MGKVILNIILLPFLPVRLGWKMSSGCVVQFNGGGGSAFLGRIIGTVLIAGLLYGAVFAAFDAFFGKKNDASNTPDSQTTQIEQMPESAHK